MAVRHEDIAIRGNGDSGRPVEEIRTNPANAGCADGHQLLEALSPGAQLEDRLPHRGALRVLGRHTEDERLVVAIRRPDVSIVIHREPVRVSEQTHPKTPDECARRVELQNRRVGVAAIEACGIAVRLVVETAVEDPDIAARRDVHSDHLAPLPSIRAFHAGWQRGPVGREAIRIGKLRFRDRRGAALLGVHGRRGDEGSHDHELKASTCCVGHDESLPCL